MSTSPSPSSLSLPLWAISAIIPAVFPTTGMHARLGGANTAICECPLFSTLLHEGKAGSGSCWRVLHLPCQTPSSALRESQSLTKRLGSTQEVLSTQTVDLLRSPLKEFVVLSYARHSWLSTDGLQYICNVVISYSQRNASTVWSYVILKGILRVWELVGQSWRIGWQESK